MADNVTIPTTGSGSVTFTNSSFYNCNSLGAGPSSIVNVPATISTQAQLIIDVMDYLADWTIQDFPVEQPPSDFQADPPEVLVPTTAVITYNADWVIN